MKVSIGIAACENRSPITVGSEPPGRAPHLTAHAADQLVPVSAATHPSASGPSGSAHSNANSCRSPAYRFNQPPQRPAIRVVVEVQHPHHGHARVQAPASAPHPALACVTAAARHRGQLVPQKRSRDCRAFGQGLRLIPGRVPSATHSGNSWSRYTAGHHHPSKLQPLLITTSFPGSTPSQPRCHRTGPRPVISFRVDGV